MNYILGSNRGLGKYLASYFKCKQFNRPYDFNKDIEKICNAIKDDSTVILNAHASQLRYVYLLKERCKLVVMGSIAAVNPDPNMPEYSEEKQELENTVQQLALQNKHPMLYLQLTSSSYQDYTTVSRSIQFWLDNPTITFIGYNISE